jgi:hypothetical protein
MVSNATKFLFLLGIHCWDIVYSGLVILSIVLKAIKLDKKIETMVYSQHGVVPTAFHPTIP